MSVCILAENLINAADLVAFSASSEQSRFPKENVFAKTRRSKVHRSAGFWEITSANKDLIFRETVGVDLTASVAVANYTSTTSFIAAIKAALEVAGASTYTVSLDASTGKFKIVSDGMGGGGIFQLRHSDVLSTLSPVIGFDITTLDTGALTYTADLLRIHTSEYYSIDLGISTNPKAFALIGAGRGAIKISPTATITLMGNGTDVWTAPSYSQVLTYHDLAMVLIDADGLHTSGLRYWRLKIVDNDNPLGYIEVGQLYLGDYYSPTNGSAQFPFRNNRIDRSQASLSEGGQVVVEKKGKTNEFSIEWFGLSYDEVEAFDDIWADVGTHDSFFVCFDPDVSFSSSLGVYTRLVKFSDPIESFLTTPNVWSASMLFREEI